MGINFPLCLAPMVGLTHVAMREALYEYLPSDAKTIWPTEMLSSYKLPHQKNLAEVSMAIRGAKDTSLVPQILGNEKEPIQKSIQIIKEWGAVGVDLNMGCPVKKALRHNYGVSLMGDPEYAAKVVRYAVESSKLPVSVKFRAGMQNDKEVLKKFSLGVQNAGASWVTLHPRVAGQKRRGKADWSQIRFLKEILNIPVIGNGDVQNLSDFYRIREQTGCDAVMVGRALTARPWLFWQIGEDLGFKPPIGKENQRAPKDKYEEGKEFGVHFVRFIDLCFVYFSKEEALKKIRFYIRVSHPWLMFGHDFFKRVMNCHTQEDLIRETQNFFSRPQSMSLSTFNLS